MNGNKIALLMVLFMGSILLGAGCSDGGAVVAEISPENLAETAGVLPVAGEDNPLRGPCVQVAPSVRIKLPGVSDGFPWDRAKYLIFDVFHAADVTGTVRLEFAEGSGGTVDLSVRLGVMPRLRTRLVFPLEALDAQAVFLPRTPGRLKAVVFGRKVRPELLSTATVSLDSVTADQHLYVSGIRLMTELPRSYLMDGPALVDSLGQWASRDWPGKTPDIKTLIGNLKQSLAAGAENSFPDDWSGYGGYKKLRFAATGFFRVEKTGKRWWLVDPDGYAFFSTGVDGVAPLHAACPIGGIEPLFQWIPPCEGEFEPVWGDQSRGKTVDFAGANLIRAFGSAWQTDWARLTRGRMIEWRFNTMGNWSDSQAIKDVNLPYVIPLRGFPRTPVRLYRDFPDVFDPSYEQGAVQLAEGLREYRDDPMLIGYFLANEPQWAFGGLYPAAEMLESGERSATRSELVKWLASRYDNDIKTLSGAWNQDFASFEQLESGALRRADGFSERSKEDLRLFSQIMVERYLKPVSEAVRRVDPNHLNLGIRWAGGVSEFGYQTSEYCDVVTVNMYGMYPYTSAIDEINRRTGKPVLIGEYHFGAVDRGLPSTGLRGVASQEERGVAYRAYVETAAAMPGVVGTHYFIWNDQPVLGRYDGENFNIGLVDVCNTPYREMVDAARQTHERIYQVAAGLVKPYARRALEVPRIGF